MKASLLSFRDLFEPPIRFVVPIFQRGYIWTQEINWTPLWADLVDGCRDKTGAHFLGAIVLEQKAVMTGTIEVRRIIDGQQRLTTTQVLLAVLRDTAVDMGLPVLTTRLKALTVNPRAAGADAVLKVWLSAADREAFRDAMTAGSLANLLSRYPLELPLIVKAYRFFHGRVREFVSGRTSDEVTAQLQRLLDSIASGTSVIVLDLDEPDDPQSIFGTLNALGTALRAGDLVRNHLFHECDRIGLPIDDLYSEYWAPFDNGYWQAKPAEGTDTPWRMDAFLTDYLIMERGRSPVLRRLFSEFRDYLRSCGLSLPEVMARLATYGGIYASLDTDEGLTAQEAGIVSRLREARVNVFRPILMRLFADYEPQARLEALKAIESYVIRRQIIGESSKTYGNRLAGLLRRLAGDAAPGPAITAELMSRGTQWRWPTDEEVIKYLRDEPIFATAPSRVRTILLLVEAQMRKAVSEDVLVDPGNLTVEHLMPRALRLDLWPIQATGPAERDREAQARGAALHTLGNLTLITEALNKELANRSWTYKRPRLDLDSFLNLNRNLPYDWNAAAITVRGVTLAHYFCDALPRPAPSGRPSVTSVPGPPRRPARPDDTISAKPVDQLESAAGAHTIEPDDGT